MCFVANRTDFSSCSISATVGKQQKRNSTESRLFVVVDHAWILGVALASFLLNVALNVSMLFFAPPAPHRSPQKARSGQTAGRVCATFKAHTKKPRFSENICTATRHILKTSLTQTKERNTTRGRVASSSQRQHTTFTMSSRVINPNKQVAHDAVKCGSSDGLARRNFGWR